MLATRTSEAGWATAGRRRAWGPAAGLAVLVSVGCGSQPARLGVLVGQGEYQRVDAGPAPADAPTRARDPATGLPRVTGDLMPAPGEEQVVVRPGGQGITIVGADGVVRGGWATDAYVTAVGVIPVSSTSRLDVVLYLYPKPAGAGTFEVRSPGGERLATWVEAPPPSHFVVLRWQGRPVIGYLHGDSLVLRQADGTEAARWPAPDGPLYTELHALVRGTRLILLASGNGYTPYHMVLVYAADGRLLFQDVEREQAFALEADGPPDGAFVVTARSRRWRYDTGPAP